MAVQGYHDNSKSKVRGVRAFNTEIKEDSVEVRAFCDKNTECEIVLLFKKQAFVKEIWSLLEVSL